MSALTCLSVSSHKQAKQFMIRIYQKDWLNIGKVLNAKLFKEQRDEPQPMLKNVFKCQRPAFTLLLQKLVI